MDGISYIGTLINDIDTICIDIFINDSDIALVSFTIYIGIIAKKWSCV